MQNKYFIVILCIFSFPLFIFSGSFPHPKNNSDETLFILVVRMDSKLVTETKPGIIVLDGPVKEKIKFNLDKWNIYYFKLKPGVYKAAVKESNIYSRSNFDFTFVIPDNSIFLFQKRLGFFLSEDGTESIRLEDIDEGDRQKAAVDLVEYIDFASWLGRDFIGFGSTKPSFEYRQNQHQLSLSSDPSSAQIFLDDIFIGLTPLTFEIDGNKHQLQFRLSSFKDDIRYISLQRSAEIKVVLCSRDKQVTGGNKNYYRTLVAPFYNLSGKEDNLAQILGDTLIPVLKEDSRLNIVKDNIEWRKYGDIFQPDFNIDEILDIDLIATGKYLRKEENLIVIANLYDVRSETIKAGITWEGSVGLDIFSAIDEISQDFCDEVDRVIPEAGKVLVMRNDIIYSGLSSIDARIERKLQIQHRASRKHLFSIMLGINGNFLLLQTDNPDAPVNISTGTGGPYFPLALGYEYYLNNNFSLGLGTELLYAKITPFQGDDNYYPLIFSINPSMKFVIRGLKSDLVMGVGPSLGFFSEGTISWEDGQIWEDSLGPLFVLGLQWNIGFRIYLNQRVNEMPFFLYSGISEGFPQYFFEPYGNNSGFGSSKLGIQFGIGFLK